MAMIGDYHGRDTRSRAMALHQSSVYAGTIAGGWAAGYFAKYYGWRSGFYLFGALGVALGVVLMWALKEPARGKAEDPGPADDLSELPPPPDSPWDAVRDLVRTPMFLVLVAVFAGVNPVATVFLTWMPTFLGRKFGMDVAMAGLNGTAWLQIASVLGVLGGGWRADRWARRSPGGRMMTQSLGLIVAVPFLSLTGLAPSMPVLILALVGFGYFKGIYDSNVWASLFDVVEIRRRATAQGIMNSIGWACGGMASVAIAKAAERYGMGACLSATALVYLLAGALLLVGVRAFMGPRKGGRRAEVASLPAD
jgi:MFS family permease